MSISTDTSHISSGQQTDQGERPPTPAAVRIGLGLLLTAAVALLLGLDAAWPQGFVYASVGVVAVAVAMDEFSRFIVALGHAASRYVLIGAGSALFLGHWAGAVSGGVFGPWAAASAVLAVAAVLLIMGRILTARIEGAFEDIAGGLTGLVYVPLLLTFLTAVRVGWGVSGLIVVLAVCKAGSSGAYLCGKRFGRRQMTPRLSPRKTVEGAVGAFAASVLVAWALTHSPWALMPPGWAIAYGLLIAATGIYGDLAASLLKRQAGIKDWGRLLPGFGGMMDMLDDILLAAPVSYVFLRTCELLSAGG